jgi:DNA-binding NarL/FixJ family response regulator
MSIRILLVDDHGIVRSGIELIFQQADDLHVVAQAGNGFEAVRLSREHKPDVILMDITMPDLNGIDASKDILKENPEIKILALSAHCNRHFVNQMLDAGASGYVLKDAMADELIEAVRIVHAGKRFFSKKAEPFYVDRVVHNKASKSGVNPIGKLTTKERELLQLIAENKTTREAANLLFVSVKTVEARRVNIMKKLDVSGVAELTKIAIREGLTTVDF